MIVGLPLETAVSVNVSVAVPLAAMLCDVGAVTLGSDMLLDVIGRVNVWALALVVSVLIEDGF